MNLIVIIFIFIDSAYKDTTTQNVVYWIGRFPWSTFFKYLSGFVNFLVFCQYILSKIVLNKLLIGRWEGDIEYCAGPEARLVCVLIVTEHSSRANKALFYYKQVDGEKIMVRGVDELHDYDNNYKFIWSRKWNPIFFREFHVAYNKHLKSEEIDLGKTRKYTWDCNICSIFYKPKIKVLITGKDVKLQGVLHKS